MSPSSRALLLSPLLTQVQKKRERLLAPFSKSEIEEIETQHQDLESACQREQTLKACFDTILLARRRRSALAGSRVHASARIFWRPSSQNSRPAASARNVCRPAWLPQNSYGCIPPAIQPAKRSDRYAAFNGGLNLLIETVSQRPSSHGRCWNRMPSRSSSLVLPWLHVAGKESIARFGLPAHPGSAWRWCSKSARGTCCVNLLARTLKERFNTFAYSSMALCGLWKIA
jgi:hypothetical protein